MLTDVLKRLIVEAIDKEIKKLREAAALLLKLVADLEELKKKYLKPTNAAKIKFFTLIDGKKEEITNMLLPVSKKLPLSLEIVDAKGNLAAVDGAPIWDVTDAALGTVTASADGLSAEFVPAGATGNLKVQVKADADLNPGEPKLIFGELELTLIGGEAVAIAIKAGEPVDA